MGEILVFNCALKHKVLQEGHYWGTPGFQKDTLLKLQPSIIDLVRSSELYGRKVHDFPAFGQKMP